MQTQLTLFDTKQYDITPQFDDLIRSMTIDKWIPNSVDNITKKSKMSGLMNNQVLDAYSLTTN
jgi:hypothetical protein